MSKLHIDEVYNKDSSYPLVINFQNGYITDNFKTKQCKVLEDEKTDRKTVAFELNDVIYAGEESVEELGKTLLLARDRKSGKVRLIEVGVAELKPHINFDDKPEKLLETSNLELSRKFGSKKQKQQIEQRERLKVDVDTVTEQMQKVTETVSEDKLDLSSYNKTDSDDFYIPSIDRNADSVENVYDVNKILTEEQFEKIYSELEDKDYTSDMVPCIKNIVNSKKLSKVNTVLAVYANSLLKLYTTVVKELMKKGFVACAHSTTLNDVVIANFMTITNNRRTRPTPYKDKSLCYAIVFLLLINNYKFEIEALCQDVKLTANTASLKIKVTGASVVNSGSKKIAQLKLPLNTKTSFRRKSAKF